MTQTPRSPESLERRISTLETSMVDLRASAEALLQTAQLHQVNFEVMARELNTSRLEAEASRQHFKQLHEESNQRFEIMLADMRQFRIESELRFNGMQTEIRRLIDQLFNQNTTEEN